MGLLTAPFSRKAKLTVFEPQRKVNHQLRFLPMVELYFPPREDMPRRILSRQFSRLKSTEDLIGKQLSRSISLERQGSNQGFGEIVLPAENTSENRFLICFVCLVL